MEAVNSVIPPDTQFGIGPSNVVRPSATDSNASQDIYPLPMDQVVNIYFF